MLFVKDLFFYINWPRHNWPFIYFYNLILYLTATCFIQLITEPDWLLSPHLLVHKFVQTS